MSRLSEMGFFDRCCLVLKHPIRREILESLWKRDCSFIELNDVCEEDHGRLGYHLRRMKGLVEHDPERKVYRLTDEGRLFYEGYIQILGLLRRLELDLKVTKKHNPIRYAEGLSLSDHAVLFYDDETAKRIVTIPFLKAGLLRDLAVFYLASEQTMDREAEEMRKNGIDVEELEKAGVFTFMSGEEWYLHRGKASANTIIGNWLKLTEAKLKKGFRGLQVAGEMNAFFDNAKTRELLLYERKLGQKVPHMVCALCMYEASRLQPEEYTSVIEAHGHRIHKGYASSLLS